MQNTEQLYLSNNIRVRTQAQPVMHIIIQQFKPAQGNSVHVHVHVIKILTLSARSTMAPHVSSSLTQSV